MNIPTPICAVVLLHLISGVTCAQPSYSMSVGATLPFSMTGHEINSFMHSYWAVGISGSVVARYPIAAFMDLTATLEHDLYPYVGTTGWTPSGDYKILAVSGDPAQLTRFGLGMRFASPSDTNKTKPFLLVGGGYALERYGRIVTTGQDLYGTISTGEWETPGQSYWTIWLGAGIMFRLSRRLTLESALQYRFRLDDLPELHRFSYCSATMQLGYEL